MGFDGTWRAVEEVVVDIIDRRGVTPTKLGGEFTSSGHRVISAKLVKGGRLDLAADEPRFVEPSIYEKWMRSPLQSGDVLMTSEAPLGELAYMVESADWCLGQRLFALRPNTTLIDGRFLYYALQTAEVRADINSRASGTTVLGIRQAELRKVRVPVPSLDEQKLASSLLGALDDRIDFLRQTNTTLEAIAQALFKSWFVDFDPVRAKAEGREPEGMDAATAALFPSEFEESELGLIPKGWRVGKFGDVLTESTSRVKERPAIVMSAVQSGELVRSEDHFNKRVHSEDISKYKLVSPFMFAYNPSRINIGSIGLNLFGVEGAVSPIYVVAEPKSEDFAYLIWHLLRTATVRSQIISLCSGSVRQALTSWDFFSLRMVVPPDSVASAFRNLRCSLFGGIGSNTRQAEILVEVRDTLLPRLISGKLRLPEAEKAGEDAFA